MKISDESIRIVRDIRLELEKERRQKDEPEPLRDYSILPPLGAIFPKIICIDENGKEWRYKGELLGGKIEETGFTVELHIEAESH